MRIVIAEDSVLLREGLRRILVHFDHVVVAAVADSPGLVAAVDAHGPDIVITDVRMPPGFGDEGLRAALALRAEYPGLPILVLSQYVEQSYAADLLHTGGGVGYLLKDRVGKVAEFIDALERVASGGTVIDPDVVRGLLTRPRGDSPLLRLTEREGEVLALMAEGRSNGAIAGNWLSAKPPWSNTPVLFSPNSTSTRPPTITGECWRCSPTSVAAPAERTIAAFDARVALDERPCLWPGRRRE